MTDKELLLHQLKNPPVMSMALNKDHLYQMMAERMQEAADRIEQLVATNEALLAERKKDHANINLKADFIDKTINQLAEADAKLAKAVEALRPFAEVLKGNYSHQSDGLPISMGHGKDDLRWVLPLGKFRLARATIAEIKSGVATTPYGLEGESHDPL